MRSRYIAGTLVSLLFSLWLPSAPPAAQELGATTRLEEIIVTARRREENLLDLPASIAALTAETMRTQGIFDIEDISDFVPNLLMGTSDRANNNFMWIRGIGGGSPDPLFPFGTGMYIDGHYMPSRSTGYMSTMDIERVEVLRGPQGTLFGKNTTGGAVSIIAAKPEPDFASSLLLRAGEFGRRDIRGMLNFPISDKVSARITAAKEQDDGYYYNRNLGVGSDGGDLEAIRAALRFRLGEHWIIDTTISLARQRDDESGAQCSSGNGEVAWGGSFWYGDSDSEMLHAVCDEEVPFGPFVYSSDKLTFSNIDEERAFVVAEWDSAGPVGALDNLTAKMTASYGYSTYSFLQDRDYSSLRIDATGTVGGPDANTNRTRNAELVLEGIVNDRLDFVAGVNYFEETALTGKNRCYTLFVEQHDLVGDNDVECLPQEGLFFELVPDKVQIVGDPDFTAGPPTFFKNGSVWNESLGIFGHMKYRLTDNWELDFGTRYTEDRRAFNNIEFHISNYQRTNDLGLGSFDLIMNNLTVVENGFFNEGADTFSDVTSTISLTRHLAAGERLDGGMFYLLFAQGFLTGGFNNELNTSPSNPYADLLKPYQSYDPEHLDNYEIGFKGAFWDGRLGLNTSVYFMDYHDIHSFVNLDNSESQLGGGSATISLLTNIAKAEIYGFETELQAQPWRGGFVSVALGYNHYGDLPYRTIDPEALEEQGVVQFVEVGGDSDDFWTLNVSLQHTFNLPNGASLTPMLGFYHDYFVYNPRYPPSPDPTPTAGPSPCEGDTDPFARWRGRLTYDPPSRNYQISLFGMNIADDRIFNWCTDRRGAYVYKYARPARWGIEFFTRWGDD